MTTLHDLDIAKCAIAGRDAAMIAFASDAPQAAAQNFTVMEVVRESCGGMPVGSAIPFLKAYNTAYANRLNTLQTRYLTKQEAIDNDKPTITNLV